MYATLEKCHSSSLKPYSFPFSNLSLFNAESAVSTSIVNTNGLSGAPLWELPRRLAFLDVKCRLSSKRLFVLHAMTMTMTMTHSEKSHIRRMKAWPYRQSVGVTIPQKESVLLMELAHWQGVQVQTVMDRVQCIKSRDEPKVQENNKDTRPHRLLLC